MDTSILDSFANSNVRQPMKKLQLLVTDYILPSGQPESSANSRIIGIDVETNKKVEIALREPKNPTQNRKGISSFHNDSGQGQLAVTIKPGGYLIADYAYPDDSLKPLSKEATEVISCNWINRISPGPQQGFTLGAIARVDPPRLKDSNNPAKGSFQTLSILDKAFKVSNLDDLDAAIKYALNPEKAAEEHTKTITPRRPGRLTAFVRMSVGDQAHIYELRGKYVKDEKTGVSLPLPSEFVLDDLKNNAAWQTARGRLGEAFKHDDYKIEVITGCIASVGIKAVDKALKSAPSPIKGVTTEVDGKETSSFTKMTIGFREYSDKGRTICTFAQPTYQTPQHHPAAMDLVTSIEVGNKTRREATPAKVIKEQAQEAKPVTPPIQPAAPIIDENIRIEITTTKDPALLRINPVSTMDQKSLIGLASYAGGRVASGSVLIESSKLSGIVEKLEKFDSPYIVSVAPPSPVIEPDVASKPATQQPAPAPALMPIPEKVSIAASEIPTTQLPFGANTTNTEAESSFDLGTLNLDEELDLAFKNSQTESIDR